MTMRYEEKRDFSKTTEPEADRQSADNAPIFVIQKHDASSLHYDFRINVGGALKSWAIPKGPSTDPREKRLALRTEDHPRDYADFEGVIPEGEYGAGTVLVWDRGTWENITRKEDGIVPAEKALEQGHLLMHLEGEKIAGGYALQRTETGDDEKWLLVKMDDDAADARRNPVSTQPESVLSGRTIAQVRRQEGDGDADDAS
ncbi:MAG: DNA ligase (ATP) [Saliniramus fredricksonii]|uniref:DNA ligase (ATP) n=1 Tax=Saliniramus fredricksonii TaxID=1653334 RepID=A0A0P7Y1M5_9HYPH|nr:DNA polymerase ligase N-terminal domain-containing protein [Saliniramus fredricksonii]KPQ10241.1 MAG: DNA ligase (ATP) [Saliniramus fredricksonii]SCC80977.1 DNA ligase D, 3'-phosphoesterase domain-containing protein [Saliniramus fredricksonii]